MNNWFELTTQNIKSVNIKNADKILSVLFNIKTQFLGFTTNVRSRRTRLIKKELSKLGHELCYKVYSNGLTEEDIKEIISHPKNPKCKKNGKRFKKREWLFDLHWYTEDGPYTPISLPLVVECEWDKERKEDEGSNTFSAVKFDFQKLIVSNAELRLLIFKAKEDELKILYEYFKKVINSYIHLEKAANFIFVAFDTKQQKVFYIIVSKKTK